jgi:RimJ/RimL family protein N-acetyltransferase
VRQPLPRGPTGPLSDGVVTLRPWREEDVPAIVAICDDPDVARFTRVPAPYTEQDARDFLAGTVVEELGFAIVSAEDEEDVLGSIGIRDAGDERAEVGYLVGARVRGRGVASRALQLLSDWALGEEGGMARVQLVTRPDNVASQRTAERAGFRREGLLRSYMLIKGERHDAIMFARLRRN